MRAMTLSAFTRPEAHPSARRTRPGQGSGQEPLRHGLRSRLPRQRGQPRRIRLPDRGLLEHREVLRQERRLVRGAGTRVLHVPEGVHQGAPRPNVIMAEGHVAKPRSRDRVFQETDGI